MPIEKEPALAEFEEAPRVTIRVQSPALQPMNGRELQAIYSLFAWVADEQDTAPETVRSITEAHFGTGDVTALLRKNYDEVIKFLVDLRIDELRN